jgi:hypothetical protein
MKTLIMYDNTGYIYLQMSGIYRVPQGNVQFIEIEVPTDKRVKEIDITVTPNVPIYEDAPKTESELLKQQLLETQTLLSELIEIKYNALLTI